MALPNYPLSDFAGPINISQTEYNEPDFLLTSEAVRNDTIRRILSDAAFVDIRDNSKDKWDDLLNGNDYQDKDGVTRINDGLSKTIQYWIYFRWAGQAAVDTPTGSERNKNENSTPYNPRWIAVARYNTGVSFLDSIYCFTRNYSNITDVVTSSVDNGGGNYTLTVPVNAYLYTGDTIAVNNEDFIVTTVAPGTIVIAGATTGLDFTGDTYSYSPFYGLNLPKLQTIFE